MKQLILALAAFLSAAALADVKTIYTGWGRNQPGSNPANCDWTDADGNRVDMLNNGTEYAVVTQMVWSQSFNSGCDWNLNGLFLDNADRSYADGSGLIGLQRGGLRCAAGCRFAKKGGGGISFKLIAGPQTWEGPDSGEYASIGTGDDGHNSYSGYYTGKVAASSDVYSWTIRKRLAVWMYYENVLSHVSLRLESPARIYLPTQWGTPAVTAAPKLGVGELTLAGEDVMWFAGVKTAATLPMCGVAPTGVLNPVMDEATVASRLILEGGADVQVANATWDIPELVVTGTGAESAFLGDLTFLRSSTSVELRDGARLAFAATNGEAGVSAGLAVSGTGTVAVATAGWKVTGTLALGGDVWLELEGETPFAARFAGGKGIVVNPGADCSARLDSSLKALLAKTAGGSLAVASGTFYIGSMDDLAADATVDIAADAAVVFASDAGYDASRVTGAGKANVTFDPDLVSDTVVAASEIVIRTNEVLRVAGDGLTAATTVRLAGGTLCFLASATVASPIRVDVASFVEAACENVQATVSGAVACQCGDGGRKVAIPVQRGSATTVTASVNGLWNLGPGTVTYAGGGTFAGTRDTFVVTRDARVNLTGGCYNFVSGRGDAPGNALVRLQALVAGQDYGYGRRLCVRDGGSLAFKAHVGVNECVYVASPKNGSLYNLSPWVATFEIGAGGAVTIPGNGRFRLGSVDSLVELRLTGGLLDLAAGTAQLLVGDGSSTYGAATAGADIRLEGGTLSLGSPIVREKGGDATTGNRSTRGRFLWSGGTLKLNASFAGATIFDISQTLKDATDARVNGYLRQIVQISGEDCTLDLSEMGVASVANVPAGMNQAEWYGTGALTVTGGKEFVMNAFPNAMTIRTAGEGTKVTVPDAAYVYDNATCAQYLNARMDDGGAPYDTIAGARDAATVAKYVSAGTNCAFAVTRANLPLTVTETLVTGDWNNVRSVSAPGGLTLGDMTFAEGSMLTAAVKNRRTVCQQVDGTVTLPSSLSIRSLRDDGVSPTGDTVLSAAGGIVGSPEWIGVRGCQAEIDGSTVKILFRGSALLVR